MKQLFLMLAVVFFAATVSCGSNRNKVNNDGWMTIFDGSSFDGWRGYCQTEVPPQWTIESDGSMKFNGPEGEKRGHESGLDLIYDRKLKNFELEFEWNASQGGNSGLLYYAQEVAGKPIYTSAPEYQLCAVDGSGRVSTHEAGSLYDLIAADPQNAKIPGEWNKARLTVDKGKVIHYQNDVKVCEYTLWTPEWKALLDGSKFSEEKWPEAYHYQINAGGDRHEGYIGFQDHGTDFRFRNIRLRELP
jgi:hypothetical protein